MHHPVPSPRQAVSAIQKTTTRTAATSDMTNSHAGPSSRPQGVNYQNASTQYSPVENPGQKTTPQEPAKFENSSTEDAAQEASVTNTSSAITIPEPQPATASDSLALSAYQESPTSRRRQFRETTETDSASPTSLAYPPKRTKPSKTTAKSLPVKYEFCEVEDMVALIADMISELIETNDNLPLRDVVLTRFHSRFVLHATPAYLFYKEHTHS